MRIRLRLAAAAEVEGARGWYDGQRVGLGDEFVEALEQAIELVGTFPDAFPEIANSYRRALLHRFPYSLYYRVERDVIDVVACLHASRSPEAWQSRG